MPFTLQPLPYDKSALAPTVSALTMAYHYEKHHRGYVDKLNTLTAGTPMSDMSLGEVIAKSWGNPSASAIFNNAAQVANHDFLWRSMVPSGGKKAIGSFGRRIESDFGSYEAFERKFVEAAVGLFGSGWAWLVADAGRLRVVSTNDAVTPLVLGVSPLLACDVWEHAYYLDYQNEREKYVRGFLNRLANWDFAGEQLAAGEPRRFESASVKV